MEKQTQITNATPLFGLPSQPSHERVQWVSDPGTGLRAIIAVHSTRRGPAFGGCRMFAYASDQEALTDALRLSHGMSLKNALANLPFGGGKAVIIQPDREIDRTSLFRTFGHAINSLGGRYITAEDVGTTTSDMRVVQRATKYVSGIPRDSGGFGGDPSPKTAWGVFVSIEEAVRKLQRRSSLQGTRVAVQGLGAVGASLCGFLHDAGARLVVADVRSSRVEEMKHRYGAEAASVESILTAPADVFAPCAMGAVLTHSSASALQSPLVAGAANNQLEVPAVGERLKDLGVTYLPDFLVNAGGIISVVREYLGTGNEAAVMAEVGNIRLRVAELLERVEGTGESPDVVATRWANEKLAEGR